MRICDNVVLFNDQNYLSIVACMGVVSALCYCKQNIMFMNRCIKKCKVRCHKRGVKFRTLFWEMKPNRAAGEALTYTFGLIYISFEYKYAVLHVQNAIMYL